MINLSDIAKGSGGSVPPGFVVASTFSTLPDGYLECNGAAVSRSSYSDLFSAIGTSYGVGDGSTTFNIPDFRGQFLRGWAHGATTDPDRASRTNRGDGITGDNIGTKQADGFKSHFHSMSASINDAGGAGSVKVNPNPTTTQNTNSTGGNETRPKNINVMYCIKY